MSSEEPISREDQEFAGLVVLTAALGDVADELRRINKRLDQVISLMYRERERYTWRIVRR